MSMVPTYDELISFVESVNALLGGARMSLGEMLDALRGRLGA